MKGLWKFHVWGLLIALTLSGCSGYTRGLKDGYEEYHKEGLSRSYAIGYMEGWTKAEKEWKQLSFDIFEATMDKW